MKKNFKFNKKYINYLSSLSNLKISRTESDSLIKDLQDTLKYIENINQLNTSGVKTTDHTGNLENITFSDGKLNKRKLTHNQVFQNSKNLKNNYFVTKKIL